MNPLRFLRNFAALAFVVGGLLSVGVTDAEATHFRYGTIKWRIDQVGTVFNLEVTAECAWRRSFYNPQPVEGGQTNTGQILRVQGTGYTNSTPLIVDVTAVNPLPEDWFVGSRTFVFGNIPVTALPLRVFWNGNARISTLMDGNADDFFNVEARVSNDPTNIFSPVASLLPIISVAHGQPAAKLFIPASDPVGDPLTWSISTTARSSLTKAAPDGFPDTGVPTLSISPTTGEVTWNTAAEAAPGPGQELYAVQFLVTDSKGGEIPVDALFRLVPNTSQPPSALVDNSPNAAQFDVSPGSPITFVFKGTDPDPTDIVTLAVGGGMPGGATFTPSLPFSGTQPQSATFNWTPTLADVGSHVISLSVTDNFALQDTNSATITVLPDFQPEVDCPGSVTMEATGPTTTYTASIEVDDQEGQAMTVKWSVDGVLVKTDNVPPSTDPTTVTFEHDYTVGSHLLTVEVTDPLTPPVFCNATVAIRDTVGPVITLPPSQILEATSPAGAVATWSPDPPLAEDLVDGPVPVTCDHASGETFPILPPPPQDTTTIVTCTAQDAAGNVSTGTFDITVQDTTAPDVTVPGTITKEATGPTGATATFTASATDIVDGSITPTCAPASGSTFPLGDTTVTCSATDVHGNTGTAQFLVSVVDTTPPDVTVPGTITEEATGPNGATVTYTASAFDIVDGNIIPTCTPASGSTFPLGSTTVVCTATDAHNNTGSAQFVVNVVDTGDPVVTVPGPMTVEATSPAGAPATFTATAFDLVDGNLTPTCAPASGSVFPLFPPPPATTTTTVTCTATDSSGNTGSASFTVTVQDTTAPAISNMPADISVQATSPAGAIVNWDSPTAFDIVDQTVAVTCVPPSGSLFPVGVTTVSCSASDIRGNTSTESFTVTVAQLPPPVPCVTLSPGVLWPPNHRMETIQVTATVPGEPTAVCQISSVTSTEPVQGQQYGRFAPDWIFSGLDLQLRVERYNKPGRTYSVTVSCTGAGGSASTVAKLLVPHDQSGHDVPPVNTCR